MEIWTAVSVRNSGGCQRAQIVLDDGDPDTDWFAAVCAHCEWQGEWRVVPHEAMADAYSHLGTGNRRGHAAIDVSMALAVLAGLF